MYAGTKVNWHEVLMADSNKSSIDDSLPLFLCAFSADKGSEEITDLTYSEFKKMYRQLLQVWSAPAAGSSDPGRWWSSSR